MSNPDGVLARFTYDRQAHALYLYLAPDADGKVVSTATMPALVNADLDQDGRVVGVEVLNPWPQNAPLSEIRDGSPSDPLRLYTIPETADLLGVSRAHAYRLVADGELGTVDVAVKGSRKAKSRITSAALAAFIASRSAQGEAGA
jgi:excisionase family DNA binding protein